MVDKLTLIDICACVCVCFVINLNLCRSSAENSVVLFCAQILLSPLHHRDEKNRPKASHSFRSDILMDYFVLNVDTDSFNATAI